MDYLLGDICLFPYNFVPRDWAECNGAILQVSENAALFSLLGTTYGGNGISTFGLPNLQGAEPLPGMRYCIAIRGLYPQRQ